MSEINVHFVIYGKYKSYIIEKTILDYNEEEELDNLKLKTIIDGVEYSNTKEFAEIEYAIVDIQKQLPTNIQIACCQSCKHGNFCPFGNAQNEIFCLINYNPKSKMDVVDIFSSPAYEKLPKNELLFWCEKYQPIDDDYVYNDWTYHFKAGDDY